MKKRNAVGKVKGRIGEKDWRGCNSGRPSVISEMGDSLRMTHSMKQEQSARKNKIKKTAKAPQPSDPGNFTALGATVGGMVPG